MTAFRKFESPFRSILLKNSAMIYLSWLSGIFLPLIDERERFIGRSGGSIFSPVH